MFPTLWDQNSVDVNKGDTPGSSYSLALPWANNFPILCFVEGFYSFRSDTFQYSWSWAILYYNQIISIRCKWHWSQDLREQRIHSAYIFLEILKYKRECALCKTCYEQWWWPVWQSPASFRKLKTLKSWYPVSINALKMSISIWYKYTNLKCMQFRMAYQF